MFLRSRTVPSAAVTTRTRSFHAWAISSGRWRVSIPGWCRPMSAQKVPASSPARLTKEL